MKTREPRTKPLPDLKKNETQMVRIPPKALPADIMYLRRAINTLAYKKWGAGHYSVRLTPSRKSFVVTRLK